MVCELPIKELLAAARGETESDLVIRGGSVANVLSMEIERADVAVKNGIIVGVGFGGYVGREEVDASGRIIIPGLIDGHIHIESSLLTPSMFARAVAPLGTTTLYPDPHEIANTCGIAGMEYMYRDAARTPLDFFFAGSSCVPASEFETAYQTIGAFELSECFDSGWSTHLGEMMDFNAVIGGDKAAWDKIKMAEGIVKTGHAPGVTGNALCAYLLSGCDSDHECNFADEALEKLRRGMWLMLRESTVEHNLDELVSIILADETRASRCMAVSDDLTTELIFRVGHMDYKVRKLVTAGVRPITALAMVTVNPANYFRSFDRGAIAPGRIADMALVESIEECCVRQVWKRGVLIADEGVPLFHMKTPAPKALFPNRASGIKLRDDFLEVKARDGARIRIIDVLRNTPLTKCFIDEPTVKDGLISADNSRDISKMVVVEKNHGTGQSAVGFVRGLGLERGAIGSSVAHDAHNFIAIGADDESMKTAINFLIENEGGLVLTAGENVIASLPLPVGGLMSDLEPAKLALASRKLVSAAAELGCASINPFAASSLLSLSVIPELKLTDKGYIDPAKGCIVSLFVD